jgi:hypothetical protein
MTLDDVSVVHVPDYTSMKLTVALPRPGDVPSASFAGKTLPTDQDTSYMKGITYDPNCRYWLALSGTGPGLVASVTFGDPQPGDNSGTPHPCFAYNGQYIPGQYHYDRYRGTVVFDTTTEFDTSQMVDGFVTNLPANAVGTETTLFFQRIRHDDPSRPLTLIEQALIMFVLNALEDDARAQATVSATSTSPVDAFSFSLNRFISNADQMRVTLWRSL